MNAQICCSSLKTRWLWGEHCALLTQEVVVRTPSMVSIYSFNGVFPGLGLLQSGCNLSHNLFLLNLSHSLFTAQISSVHWVVFRDEIQVLIVIVWCEVVSHWVKNTLHYLLMIFRFPQFTLLWNNLLEVDRKQQTVSSCHCPSDL